MIFFLIVAGILLVSGWWVLGLIILAGVVLWSRHDTSRSRDLSTWPEAAMFYAAILGILTAVSQQLLG